MLRRALLLAAAFLLALPAAAQVQRNFPQNALRGAIVFGAAPEIPLNGQPARLAPGARIRDSNNMIGRARRADRRQATSSTTRSTPSGLVKDVWILRPEEAASPALADLAGSSRRPGPSIPIAQVWTKP